MKEREKASKVTEGKSDGSSVKINATSKGLHFIKFLSQPTWYFYRASSNRCVIDTSSKLK